MTVVGVLERAVLFELAFGLWIGLAFILEARGARGISEDELEVNGIMFVATWLIVGVSFIVALVGAVLAESIRANQGRWAVVALVAGLLFGAGWVIVIGIGLVVSKVASDVEVIGMMLFWSYLILGPLFAFAGSAKLVGRRRRVAVAA